MRSAARMRVTCIRSGALHSCDNFLKGGYLSLSAWVGTRPSCFTSTNGRSHKPFPARAVHPLSPRGFLLRTILRSCMVREHSGLGCTLGPSAKLLSKACQCPGRKKSIEEASCASHCPDADIRHRGIRSLRRKDLRIDLHDRNFETGRQVSSDQGRGCGQPAVDRRARSGRTFLYDSLWLRKTP